MAMKRFIFITATGERSILRMKKLNSKYFVIGLILLVIIFVGNKLREFSYSSVPNPGEVADEYSYGWLGLSLIKDKYPISWSLLAGYSERRLEKINVDSIYDLEPARPPFPIVKPLFDHPPFFGLITGGYAYLKGARSFEEVSVILLRRPMLKIAILTTVLIFVLGSRLFSVRVGLLAALLYSIIPTTVISSRLALMENGYTPLFLGSVILADYYLTDRKKRYWILAVMAASAAMLFKLSAVSIAVALFFIGVFYGKKDRKFLIMTLVGGALFSLFLFFLYGALFDLQTFVKIFFENSNRFYGTGAEIFWNIVGGSRITTTKFLTDGWILAGWISFFVLSFTGWRKTKGSTVLSIAIFSYLAVLILFGGESYGWYKFPFFPFLVISCAWLIDKLYQELNLLVFTGLMLLPFGTSLHRLIGVENFQSYVPAMRLFAVFVLVLYFLAARWNNKVIKLIYQVFVILALVFVIWISVKEINFYSYENWFKVN